MLRITADEYRDGRLRITGEKYHHLARVRRVRVGETLQAALPDGRVLVGQVTAITAEAISVVVTEERPASGLSPCQITLYQAALKGEKMDLVVQKAAELGTARFVPLIARRSVPRWEGAQARARAERWQRIADAAAEQSERSLSMEVAAPIELRASLADALPLRLLLHERQGVSLRETAARYPNLDALGLYIGPEGGWDDEEVRVLLAGDVQPIHLGPRILRAETAAVTAVALAQFLWGDLG